MAAGDRVVEDRELSDCVFRSTFDVYVFRIVFRFLKIVWEKINLRAEV